MTRGDTSTAAPGAELFGLAHLVVAWRQRESPEVAAGEQDVICEPVGWFRQPALFEAVAGISARQLGEHGRGPDLHRNTAIQRDDPPVRRFFPLREPPKENLLSIRGPDWIRGEEERAGQPSWSASGDWKHKDSSLRDVGAEFVASDQLSVGYQGDDFACAQRGE